MAKYTDDELIWLAEALDESKKANGGRARRAEIIRQFKKQFKKTLTAGKLAALYRSYFQKQPQEGTKANPQTAFITAMFRKKRERERRAGIVERIDPVKEPITNEIERPPEAAASASEIRVPESNFVAEPNPAQPLGKESYPQMTKQPLHADHDFAAVDQALASAPRYSAKDITPVMKNDIAIRFGEWGRDSRSHRFRRPAAYAAYSHNVRRKHPSDPVLNAAAIEALIGSELKVKEWLLGQPEFVRHYAPAPVEIASAVANKKIPFLNW